MRQNQRIIKKGDYYELEPIEDVIGHSKVQKRQQLPSTVNIAQSQSIVTEVPSYAEARANYLIPQALRSIKQYDFNELLEELQNILNQAQQTQNISLQQQTKILINQIKAQKISSQIPINKLPYSQPFNPQKAEKEKIKQQIKLAIKADLNDLQLRITKLEELNYPQINHLENILQIMLGQKATNIPNIGSVTNQLNSLDAKTKQQIQTLYSHLNALSCLNNLQGLLSTIYSNDAEYIEMGKWVQKAEYIGKLNKTFKMELQADELLLQQLKSNFKDNVQQFHKIINLYKEKIKQSKKN